MLSKGPHQRQALKKGTGEAKEVDWREIYGIAVSDLGLAPSEVRQMTFGEIGAVIWARRRDSEERQDDDVKESMYRKLQQIKGRTL
jgi:hypothetical protein